MTLSKSRMKEIEKERQISVAHARRLIDVYKDQTVVERPPQYEWAQAIDRLAGALEAAGVPLHIIEAIATNQPPVPQLETVGRVICKDIKVPIA